MLEHAMYLAGGADRSAFDEAECYDCVGFCDVQCTWQGHRPGGARLIPCLTNETKQLKRWAVSTFFYVSTLPDTFQFPMRFVKNDQLISRSLWLQGGVEVDVVHVRDGVVIRADDLRCIIDLARRSNVHGIVEDAVLKQEKRRGERFVSTLSTAEKSAYGDFVRALTLAFWPGVMFYGLLPWPNDEVTATQLEYNNVRMNVILGEWHVEKVSNRERCSIILFIRYSSLIIKYHYLLIQRYKFSFQMSFFRACSISSSANEFRFPGMSSL